MLQDLLLVVGVIIVTFVALRLGWRRRLEAAASSPPAPTRTAGWQFGPPEPANAPSAGVPATSPPTDEMQDVLIQLQTVSREVESRLDTRIRYAKRLLQDAEGICQRLQGLLDAAQRMRPTANDLPDTTRQRRTDSGLEDRATPRLRPEPDVSAETPEAVDPSPEEARPRIDRDEVGRLAAQGLGPVEIANRVDRPVGEIELMLALNRHAPPAQKPPVGGADSGSEGPKTP